MKTMDKREYPSHPIVGVGIVVFNKKNKVLLIKRNKPPLKDSMSIPGGKVELGETLKDAIKREVKEECGIDVDVKDLIYIAENIQKDEGNRVKYHYVLLDFWGITEDDVIIPQKDEIKEWIWVDEKELKKYNLWDKTLELIQKGYEELKNYRKKAKNGI